MQLDHDVMGWTQSHLGTVGSVIAVFAGILVLTHLDDIVDWLRGR